MGKNFLIAVALLGLAGAESARAGEANWSAAVEVPAGTGVYHVTSYAASMRGEAAVAMLQPPISISRSAIVAPTPEQGKPVDRRVARRD